MGAKRPRPTLKFGDESTVISFPSGGHRGVPPTGPSTCVVRFGSESSTRLVQISECPDRNDEQANDWPSPDELGFKLVAVEAETFRRVTSRVESCGWAPVESRARLNLLVAIRP